MKRSLSRVLLSALLIGLCACSSAPRAEEQAREPAAEPEYYWTVESKSGFPLGLNAQVTGIAADRSSIFVLGSRKAAPSLVRMGYQITDHDLRLGESEELELPEHPEGAQALGLSYGAGCFYVLLGIPQEEAPAELSYLVGVYQPGGCLERSLTVEYAEDETPLSILAMEDGSFCLRGAHHFRRYAANGELIAELSQYRETLCPPLLINGELIIQSIDPETSHSVFNTVDFERQRLRAAAKTPDVGAPKSLVQSAIGSALINNGAEIMQVNEQLEAEPILDWYALTADYGHDYRYLCQLEESFFLAVPKGSGEVRQLSLRCQPEKRKLVRVGFYGQSADLIDMLAAKFNQYNPDYKVEAISYGSDEAGLTRLLAEIGSRDRLDIVISEGYLIDPGTGFANLYPLIDGDGELSWDSFLPFMLEGLEKDGELKQIWGSFGISSAVARNSLAECPTPLRLADCQSYLDGIGYEEPLFDSYLTRELLLSAISNNLIADAYEEETDGYTLDSSHVRELLTLCRTRPENDGLPQDGTSDGAVETSEVFSLTDIQLDYLNTMEERGESYRLFDGSDGGDNFTCISAYYRSCFMIPATCGDKENAWGFLRTLLTADFQLKAFAETHTGYPTNAEAFQTVLDSYASEKSRAALLSLVEHGELNNYDTAQLRKLFLECMRPYLYDEYDLTSALNNAQGRINLYAAEHG